MSTTQTVINPSTGPAVGSFDAGAYAQVTAFATGLAGAEAVAVMLGGGPVLVAATKADGTALTLTLASPSVVLPGGPLYVFQAPATVGPSGVFCAPRLP